MSYQGGLSITLFAKFVLLVFYIVTLFLSSCGDTFDLKSQKIFLPPIKISQFDGKEMVLVPAGEFKIGRAHV